MMPGDFNKAILLGRLVKDPETILDQNDEAQLYFILATSKRWKDQRTGMSKEKTQFIPVRIPNKLSSICRGILFKGSTVMIEGMIITHRSTEGKDVGEVLADNIQFVESRKDANAKI